MKLRTKIFISFLVVYIITIIGASIVIIQSIHSRDLKNEIKETLNYESSLVFTIEAYSLTKSNVAARSLIGEVTDIMVDPPYSLMIYNESGQPIINNETDILDEIQLHKAFDGIKNYKVSKEEGNFFLYIGEKIELNKEPYLLLLQKNITHIYEQKTMYYNIFIRVGILGLIVISGLSYFISYYLIKPIHSLKEATKSMEKGEYYEHIDIKKNDEIGDLINKFNSMADVINEKMEHLQREDENKEKFIGALAHEMRTPLTSIIGFAKTLKGIEYDEVMFNNSLYCISSEGERLLNLYNQLKKLILLTNDPLEYKTIIVKDLINEVIDVFNTTAEEKQVNIIVKIHSEQKLKADIELVKCALMNVVSNAINYSNKDVVIQYKSTDKGQIITVEDYGIGISEEELSKICEAFYTVDKSRSRSMGGLGLGLSISNEIMIKHGGNLKISSKIGVGTIVELYFRAH